jgi:hypothetical protein
MRRFWLSIDLGAEAIKYDKTTAHFFRILCRWWDG